MILVIDNYDSFVYNIVQYLGEWDRNIRVFRNDAITVPEIESVRPDFILISPGPGNPSGAGVSLDVIRKLGEKFPILGVCLGHQCIGEAFGGKVIRARRLMHGKSSPIRHDGKTIFRRLSDPFDAIRYHSLLVEKESLPGCLQISAWTDEGEIMGVRHKEHLIEGVQFHPESILTQEGKKLLKNFWELSRKHREKART